MSSILSTVLYNILRSQGHVIRPHLKDRQIYYSTLFNASEKSKCQTNVLHSHKRRSSSGDVNNMKNDISNDKTNIALKTHIKEKIEHARTLQSFMKNDGIALSSPSEGVPYLKENSFHGNNRKVYFSVRGCQMNTNDTEIAWSILKSNGFSRASNVDDADVVLVMTCAIRDGAEKKIWNYLKNLKIRKQKRGYKTLKIGVLGCMAERLKAKILEADMLVDLVCGPDGYRDLPRMLAETNSGQTSVNVLLSLDETYADIMPVRTNSDSCTAYVSITRGCDNMCSFCIVPFTRGKERNRPLSSIVEEVQKLSDQGIKEVTLLGQNVNSYRDQSESSHALYSSKDNTPTKLSKGFQTIYKSKIGGKRFSELLDKVSLVNSEMRIRFTSPHPKDFPDEVLDLIKERHNICNQIQLPAQSGSTRILKDMRRGYTREAYLDLVQHIRSILPDVALTSDFIAGFCGETHEDFLDTMSLIQQVRYNSVYCFPYSMREKTRAYHRLVDDVPKDVKCTRHEEMKNLARNIMQELNESQVGKDVVVLVQEVSRRNTEDMTGRHDGGTSVIFPQTEIPCEPGALHKRNISAGDYVVVKVKSASSQVLHGVPLYHTTLANEKESQEKKSHDIIAR